LLSQRPDYVVTDIYRPGQDVPVILDGQRMGEIAVDDIMP
jgi:hypothetical protein